jgi:hypothetical protein
VGELDWLEVSEVNSAELGRADVDDGAPETVELGMPVLLPTDVEFSVGYGAELVPVDEDIPLETPDWEVVPVVN